jgi:hypothetical protein
MDETRATDVADAAGMLFAGLGILTIQFFPFALPLLVLVIGPLVLLTLPLLLLALPVLLPLWLVRVFRRARARRRARAGAALDWSGWEPSGSAETTSAARSSRSSTRPRRPIGA